MNGPTMKNRPLRGQTELPAIAIAFVLLTFVVVLGITAASTALSAAERPALEQQEAIGLSEQLVTEHAHLTERANVLNASLLSTLTADELRDSYGLSPDHDVRLQLDGETLLESGDPSGGASIDRLVVVEERVERTLEPALQQNHSVTLPRRTPAVTLEISPSAPSTTVRGVRANDRLVLRNDTGLVGEFDLSLSRFETKRLTLDAAGRLAPGDVTLTYYPAETDKQTLTVTVDA